MSMFVCVCKAVRSQQVNELIDSGAKTVEAIGMGCGAGTDCGSCVRRIERMLSQPRQSAEDQRPELRQATPNKKAI